MLLAVKGARVEAVSNTEKGDANVGENLFSKLADGVGEQLRHVGCDGDGWLTNLEEAVDKGDTS